MTYTRPAPGDPGNSGPTAATTVIDALADGLERLEGVTLNALNYGAVCDGRIISVTATASSASVVAYDPTDLFGPGDVGKSLWINAAGTAGAVHACTISAVSVDGFTATVTPAPAITATAAAVVGTDNTTALNNWCAAATKHATLYLPSGDGGFYMTQGDHDITEDGVTLLGDNRWASLLMTRTNNVTVTNTAHNGNAHKVGFHHVASTGVNIGFTNGSWPTEGAGIKFTNAAGGHYGAIADSISAVGMYRGVWIEGNVGTVSRSSIFYSVRTAVECYSVLYPDWGLFFITGNYISSGGPGGSAVPYSFAGVWWRGGGGLEVSGNWIDGGRNHVYLNPDSASGSTGNIRIVGNSLEDWAWGGAGNAVQYDMSLTNAVQSYITIANNVLQTQTAKTDPAFKLFAASNPSPDGLGNYGLRGVAVSGNAGKFSGYLADLSRCRDVSVMGNAIVGKVPADHVTQANCTNVTVA